MVSKHGLHRTDPLMEVSIFGETGEHLDQASLISLGRPRTAGQYFHRIPLLHGLWAIHSIFLKDSLTSAV